jgi:cytochrome c oxidase cbb3-type subunit I/II
MPAYPGMMTATLDFAGIQKRVDAMAMIGVPYGDAVNRAPELAREQAAAIAAEIVAQGGPAGLQDREIVAIVAYLQRLGTDLKQGGTPVAQAAPAAESP